MLGLFYIVCGAYMYIYFEGGEGGLCPSGSSILNLLEPHYHRDSSFIWDSETSLT